MGCETVLVRRGTLPTAACARLPEHDAMCSLGACSGSNPSVLDCDTSRSNGPSS